jgi:hypothetical protein
VLICKKQSVLANNLDLKAGKTGAHQDVPEGVKLRVRNMLKHKTQITIEEPNRYGGYEKEGTMLVKPSDSFFGGPTVHFPNKVEARPHHQSKANIR